MKSQVLGYSRVVQVKHFQTAEQLQALRPSTPPLMSKKHPALVNFVLTSFHRARKLPSHAPFASFVATKQSLLLFAAIWQRKPVLYGFVHIQPQLGRVQHAQAGSRSFPAARRQARLCQLRHEAPQRAQDLVEHSSEGRQGEPRGPK